MKYLFKVLFGILLLVWLPSFCSAFGHELFVIVERYRVYQWFLIGLFAYLPLHFLLIRRWYGLKTFVHELTHALFSLLFFRRVTMFVVTSKNGGAVEHTQGFGGRLGDTAISLAPYFFPTITVFLALIQPLFQVRFQPWFDVAIGMTLSFHLLAALEDTRQAYKDRKFIGMNGATMHSDVGKWGIFYSAVVIAFFWIFFHGLILAQVRSGYMATWLYLKSGAVGGWKNGALVVTWFWGVFQGRIAMPWQN